MRNYEFIFNRLVCFAAKRCYEPTPAKKTDKCIIHDTLVRYDKFLRVNPEWSDEAIVKVHHA